MKTTPHLLAAGLLTVVALFSTGSAIIGGIGGFPIPTHDQRIVGPATKTDVVPAERALLPLIPELSEGPGFNPFSARRTPGGPSITHIPPPPPPQLDFPALPIMPVPQK